MVRNSFYFNVVFVLFINHSGYKGSLCCNVCPRLLLFFFQQSLAEIQQVRAKALASPTQDSPGYLLKDSGGGGGGSSSKNSSCDTDDFVMVPAHFPSTPARTFSFLHTQKKKKIVSVLIKQECWVFIAFFPSLSVFVGELTCDMPTGKIIQDSLMYSG